MLTHRKLKSDNGEIVFTNESLADLLTRLKAMEGKDIWICGGAAIVNQLLDLGLIDRFCLSVIPTLLGGGTRLFDEHEQELPLRLVSAQSYNGMVDLLYERR